MGVCYNQHASESFKYNRVVFRVAQSTAIFQRKMDTLLQGIPHVAMCLDDILVTGATEVKCQA